MDKKEYIERGALLESLKKQYGEELGWQCTVNMSDVGMMIEDAPAADVVEVVHGEWVESTHWGEWYYDCPFCDDGFATRGRFETPPNFCSNCGAKLTGAKMDGERKEQT